MFFHTACPFLNKGHNVLPLPPLYQQPPQYTFEVKGQMCQTSSSIRRVQPIPVKINSAVTN